jgi:polyhydroxybutyrate depolymerase
MRRLFLAVLALILATSARADETQRRSLAWQGMERHYFIHLPAGRSADRPIAALIALHGVVQTPAQFAKITGFDEPAERAGMAVIYPEGTGPDDKMLGWSSGFCCMSSRRGEIDDVGFVEAARADAIGKDRLDAKRIYLTGFSNGAMLVYRIAAEHSEDYAAAIAVSGSISGTGRDGKPAYHIPQPKRRLAIGIVHSLTDPYMLYDGGVSTDLVQEMGLRGRINGSVAEALDFWRRNNGCESSSPVYSDADLAVNVSSGCREHADVVLWTLKSAGHIWPATLPMVESRDGQVTVTKTVTAAEAMIAFFAAHSR